MVDDALGFEHYQNVLIEAFRVAGERQLTPDASGIVDGQRVTIGRFAIVDERCAKDWEQLVP